MKTCEQMKTCKQMKIIFICVLTTILYIKK